MSVDPAALLRSKVRSSAFDTLGLNTRLSRPRAATVTVYVRPP